MAPPIAFIVYIEEKLSENAGFFIINHLDEQFMLEWGLSKPQGDDAELQERATGTTYKVRAMQQIASFLSNFISSHVKLRKG